MKNLILAKDSDISTLKMTTRSQKRKAIAELASGDFEASLTENNSTENLIPSSSKNPRLELENLEEIKTTLRKEIMTDLTKILAENQKEMLKLIAPASKKRSVNPNLQDSDSDQENISVARTSTPVKTQTATSSKTTPNNSRNTGIASGRPSFTFQGIHSEAVIVSSNLSTSFWDIFLEYSSSIQASMHLLSISITRVFLTE